MSKTRRARVRSEFNHAKDRDVGTGYAEEMEAYHDATIHVHGPDSEGEFFGAGYYWQPEWLEFLDEPSPSPDLKHGRNGVKPQLDLVPLRGLVGVARVQAYGDRKYAPGNWRRAAQDGEQAVRDYVAAALRHWAACQDDLGAVDPESGLPHYEHALTSWLMARELAVALGLLPQDPGAGNDPRKEAV